MTMTVHVNGLSEQEKNAKEILDHIEAIKRIVRDTSWVNIQVVTDLEGEAASGN